MKKTIVLGVVLGLGMASQAMPASAQDTPPAKSATGKSTAGKTTTSKTGQKTPAAKPKSSAAAPKVTLKDQKDKASYALGMNLGANLRRQSVDVDPALITQGIKDAMAGSKTLLTEDEARAALMQLQADLRAKQEEKMKAAGAANKKEGEEYLAANKSKEGVVTLPSGLQYKILTPGTGPKPTSSDTVVCNYKGQLVNGTEFDSSYKRGQPASFPVTGVIKGWTEALQLMPVGSKWELFIPSDLAYGESGRGEIPPNATLIFEVELVSIQGKDNPAAAPAPDSANPAAQPNTGSNPATPPADSAKPATPPASTTNPSKPPSSESANPK
jgi:FKBP-type peptidyl-prolyl cis-trans isomerase